MGDDPGQRAAADWHRRRRRLAPYVERDDSDAGYRLTFPRRGPIEVISLAELRTERRQRWWNLANALTLLRVLLVPVILLFLTLDSAAARWWAFAVFVFAAVTDTIDGWVARRWYGTSRVGQLADPIADKLLVIGILFALAWLGWLPWWAVLVIAAREVAVTVLRVQLVFRRDLVMPASSWGKFKTVSQLVAVGVYLSPGVAQTVRAALLYLAVLLTVVSGVESAVHAGRLVRERTAAGQP